MPQTAVSPELRQLVQDRASSRCEYCRIPDEACFSALEIDHIIAEQHGGATLAENLALACLPCNRQKGPNVASFDPMTGELSRLFDPRTQSWPDHFERDPDGRIIGRTSIGRTTVLAFNNDRRLQERQLLIAADAWDPPVR